MAFFLVINGIAEGIARKLKIFSTCLFQMKTNRDGLIFGFEIKFISIQGFRVKSKRAFSQFSKFSPISPISPIPPLSSRFTIFKEISIFKAIKSLINIHLHRNVHNNYAQMSSRSSPSHFPPDIYIGDLKRDERETNVQKPL